MTGALSTDLIDEASQALTSVVRLTLPSERWPVVARAVNRMDDAVWAGDDKGVRAELKELRSAVIGTTPRALPGDDAAPMVNPLSYRTTDYVTRTPIAWIKVILVGGGVVLATLIVLLMVVLAVGKHAPRGPSAAPPVTTTTAPPEVVAPVEPAGGGSGGAYLASIGLLAIIGIVVFVVMIWRRRARATTPPPRATPAPAPARSAVYAPDRVPPPAEVVEAVDRVVMVLSARRG